MHFSWLWRRGWLCCAQQLKSCSHIYVAVRQENKIDYSVRDKHPLYAVPLLTPFPCTFAVRQENKIDYSARDKNPLDAVHFFDSLDASEKRKLRPDQISSMVVASYQVGAGCCVYRRGSGLEWMSCIPLHHRFLHWHALQTSTCPLTSNSTSSALSTAHPLPATTHYSQHPAQSLLDSIRLLPSIAAGEAPARLLPQLLPQARAGGARGL